MAMDSGTKTHKKNTTVTGVFFIMATVAAIIGLKLYDPLLNHPEFLLLGARNSNQIVLGAVCELILACSAAGTGIMLYPYLRKFDESWALGYVWFRMLEVVFILIGIVSVLALLSLSQAFTHATSPDLASYQTIGELLKSIHNYTFILGPNFMLGVNTFIYNYVFYRTKLVPRKLATWGIVAAILIFTAALLELFGIILQISLWGLLLAVPVFVYELTLAVWLIVKGFDQPTQEHIITAQCTR
jgi:hypothetical protein